MVEGFNIGVRHSTALRLDGVRRDVSPVELDGQRAEYCWSISPVGRLSNDEQPVLKRTSNRPPGVRRRSLRGSSVSLQLIGEIITRHVLGLILRRVPHRNV